MKATRIDDGRGGPVPQAREAMAHEHDLSMHEFSMAHKLAMTEFSRGNARRFTSRAS